MPTDRRARALNALGDPTRRSILEALAGDEAPVGRIAAGLPVSRPAVSKHLMILRQGGLVSSRTEGTRTLYRLNPKGIAGVREYFDDLWQLALERFRMVAENVEDDR